MDLIWLIPLLPGLGAAINGLVGVRFFNKSVSALVACGAMAGALVVSLVAFVGLLGQAPEAREHVVTVAAWLPPMPLATAHGIGTFQVPWSFRLDPLSGLMILVVTGIGFLIHVYSTAYMHDEPRGGYARFFCYLNLFCFFMLMLVLGGNFLVMFVGWEGVGLCSYLLIGYWYEKRSASDAGKKAFVVNRIGDWGFILGIFLIYYTFGTLDFRAVANAAAAMPAETAAFGVLSTICLLLFIGATGKSAQIPLHVWLPDAMEGPTPVSALIHAATMVTAGVYMVGRNAVIFSHAPMVMEIVAIVGVLTALMAATIGLVQYDIKRVLAYSTVSQLGYMFLAMGVGAFSAGAFHLMTHAFFKALLFLCSGAVIHAMAGEQDMRRMGGLKPYMPVTFWTMMIGTLAIAGIPPFAGFFSKDEILFRTFLANKAIWTLAALTALMTAFYMFRLMSMTFFGPYRGPAWAGHHAAHTGAAHAGVAVDADDAHGHGDWHGPHEAPKAMTVPLMLLAAGAVLAGFVGVPAALGGGNAIELFLEPSFTAEARLKPSTTTETPPPSDVASGFSRASEAAEAEARLTASAQASAFAPGASADKTAVKKPSATTEAHMSTAGELGLMLLSVAIAVVGIMTAWRVYVRRPEIAENLARRFAGPHRILSHKYYVDELYNSTVVSGTLASSRGLWTFDSRVVDGAVNGSGWATVVGSWFSNIIDKHVVDGLVNLVGSVIEDSSFVFRRLQTGLVQNYALLMLFGVFAFVSIYLFWR